MENSVVQYSPNQLAKLVDSQVEIIATSSRKVQNALEKAKNVKYKADEAAKKSAGWSFFGSDKKEAIEALQQVAVDQADSMTDLADANSEMFKQIQSMGKATKQLFVLGTSNIATIRIVEQNLREKLTQASRTKLNEQAREEIVKLLDELKNREDLLTKMDNQTEKVKEFSSKLQKLEQAISDKSVLKELCSLEESIDDLEKNISQAKAESRVHNNDIHRLEELVNDMAEKNKKETSKLSQFISETKATISNKVANLDGSLRQLVGNSVNSLDNKISSTISKVKEEMSSRFSQQDESVRHQIDDTINQINNSLEQVNESLEKGLSDSSDKINDVHTELSQVIKDNKQATETELATLSQTLIQNAKEHSAKIIDLKTYAEETLTNLNDLLGEIKQKVELESEENTKQFENIQSQLSNISSQIGGIKESARVQINALNEYLQEQERKSNIRFYLLTGGIIVSIILSVIPLFL